MATFPIHIGDFPSVKTQEPRTFPLKRQLQRHSHVIQVVL